MVKNTISALLLFICVFINGCGSNSPRTAPSNSTSPFVTELDGKKTKLSELVSTRSQTLFVFASTWCQVCKKERPVLEKAQFKSSQRSVVYIISGSPLKSVKAYVKEQIIDTSLLNVVADPEGAFAEHHGISATPTYVLYSSGAKVLGRYNRINQVPAPPAEKVLIGDSGKELGTSYDIVVTCPPDRRSKAIQDFSDVRSILHNLEKTLSEWKADSNINEVNSRASTQWVSLRPELEQIIKGAIHISKGTSGAFDPTWKTLLPLWRMAKSTSQFPTKKKIATYLGHMGVDKIVMKPGKLRFKSSLTQLGIAGVAKGWIIDTVFLSLKERGYKHIIVNIGGDIRTLGTTQTGKSPRFQLLDPYKPSRVAATISVENTAIATSGNYIRDIHIGHEKVGHILDPQSGMPPAFDGSVTALTQDAAMADAMATALFVMGPDKGISFANAHEGIDAVYLTRKGIISSNSSIKTYVN